MNENKKSLKDRLTANVVAVLLLGATLLLLLAQLLSRTPIEESKSLGASGPLGRSCSSDVATTTLNYMTPGTGTTTITCLAGRSESLRILAILVGSSTQTNYRFRAEDSVDGVDYFARLASVRELATTTSLSSTVAEYSLVFASTTAGSFTLANFGGLASTSASLISFDIPTLGSNYVRVVSYLAGTPTADTNPINTATSTRGAIWFQGVAGAEK